MLVDIFFHGMSEEYKVFLEDLSFSSFSELMDHASAPMDQSLT